MHLLRGDTSLKSAPGTNRGYYPRRGGGGATSEGNPIPLAARAD